MRSVGLEPNDRRPLRKYSMGMRQRLGIAQAIMDAPDILILDEPFNSLDKDGVKEIAALLLSLKHQGKTMILAVTIPMISICFVTRYMRWKVAKSANKQEDPANEENSNMVVGMVAMYKPMCGYCGR